jgi:histidine triad (HIT) family protein
MLTTNIFQKILDKQIPADVIYEDDQCVAFRDVNPQAPTHIVLIPRKVISTHAEIAAEDQALLGHLHLTAARLARQLGLAAGYRLVINCNDQGGQTVPHLHMHILGGRIMAWPPG